MQIDAYRAGRFAKAAYVLLALVILFILAEAIVIQGGAPTPEFLLRPNNPTIVDTVLRGSGAAAAGLLPGDAIQKVDGTPFDWSSLATFSQRYRVGETIHLSVLRNAETIEMSVPLVPAERLNLDRIIAISLFVLIGGTVGIILLWRFIQKPEAQILYLLTQAAGAAFLLPTIQFSLWDALTTWQKVVGGLAAAFSILLSFHFVVTFPVGIISAKRRHALMPFFYGLGLLIACLLVFAAGGQGSLLGVFVASVLLVLVYALTWVVLLYDYFRLASIVQRRQIRLVMVAFLVSAAPSTFLYSLPKLFLGYPLISEWLAGPCLLVSLMIYANVILSQNLSRADRLLNRTVVNFSLFAVTMIILVVPVVLLDRILPNDWIIQAFILAGLTLLVAYSFAQARRWVEQRVDKIFFGGWYDYPRVIETISAALAHSLKWDELDEILTRQVPGLMNLSGAWLNVGDEKQAAESVESQPHISIPLTFENKHYATWVIGPRKDGDYYSAADRNILSTLAPQIEVALSNILHVEKLREQLAEIRASQETMVKLGHQLIRSRDQEQKRLSRELHDGPLQELVGMNLQLGLLLSKAIPDQANVPFGEVLSDIHSEVRGLMTELREMCTGLRPPMLDALGLSSALCVLIDKWYAEEHIQVQQELPPDTTLHFLPGEVSLNLYRVVQEALSNVAHHAAAAQVSVHLVCDLSKEGLTLVIQDDGKGFEVEEGDQQSGQNHFGLANMRERVRLIGGRWFLSSSPGCGTIIQVNWQRKEWLASEEFTPSLIVSAPD